MSKQIIYNSPSNASKHKYNKPTKSQINHRYKDFNQVIFTAGDVDQFINKLPIINDDIINTFNYIYHKFKKGIFVYIKNNKLHTFLPFSKKNFINDWHHLLIHSNIKQVMYNLYRYDWDPSHWYANNCIIRNEFPVRENDSGISQLYHMLQETCKNSTIKNSYFFINKRDFPLIKKNRTEPYDCIFGDNTPLTSHHHKRYAPILSMTTTDDFEDIPIPTWDDWTNIQCINHDKYFSKPCPNKESITDFYHDWDSKKNIAVFRGSSTGKGVDKHTNTRIKLCSMKSDFLDVGITNWNNRPRIYRNKNKLILHTFNKQSKTNATFLTPKQQSSYKYIIHVDGHSSAFRLSLEMKMKSVLLIVDSDYYIWFKQQLKPYTHYIPIKKDLSDLLEKINWCKENDSKCKIIAENSYDFYLNNLQEEHIYDYLSSTINSLQIEQYKMSRPQSTSGMTRMLNKHYLNESQLYDIVMQPKNILESNKHITKYTVNTNKIFISKKANVHEAFISIFCVNDLLNTIDNFVFSYCYKNNILCMSNVEGITFQDWIISDFDIDQYLLYLFNIVEVINKYQNSKYKFVHYDLSPWNIIIDKEENIKIIDFEKSFCIFNNKEYGPYKFSSIIDVLSIIIKSLNTLFQTNTKYKNIQQIPEYDRYILLYLGNFMVGTQYRKETFNNLYDLKRFINNMSKYDNLLFMNKYELDDKTPLSFINYLKN